jgi:transposase-like protein
MDDRKRQETLKREKGRAVVRALHLSELESAGRARVAALKQAEAELDRIARALPDALDAGLTISEVARLTGVSRPTLYELQHRYGDDRNLWLGVMQVIANNGSVDSSAIAKRLSRPPKQVAKIVKELVEDGFVEEDFNEDPDYPAMECWLSDKGFAALEHFRFADDEDGTA